MGIGGRNFRGPDLVTTFIQDALSNPADKAPVAGRIPMYGDVDSLNLSVATSIILAESVNQRKIS